MTYVTELYRPQGDGEFIRLIKEYYTLEYDKFKSISEYLTHIKSLEKRILVINVILTLDKQTILCLSMLLPDYLQYLIKIWVVTPDITVAKAIIMLLEEERKGKKPNSESMPYGYRLAVGTGIYEKIRPRARRTGPRGTGSGRTSLAQCKTCKKVYRGVCWDERPDLAPEWLQERRGTKRKCTELTTESVTAVFAYSF